MSWRPLSFGHWWRADSRATISRIIKHIATVLNAAASVARKLPVIDKTRRQL
jgi:hypothetical protein